MRISAIKKKIRLWEDFYGQDIEDGGAIKSAKNKGELARVLRNHARFLEDQANDAQSHLEHFERGLGL